MTVKSLIRHLKKCDMNATVRVGTYCGTVDGIIKKIHVNVISPSNKKPCIYLGCEITYLEGEGIKQTKTVKKTIGKTEPGKITN